MKNTAILFAGMLLASAAQAQQVQPVASEPLSDIDAQHRQSTQLQGENGPVTVRWGQSATLPNAADYRVSVSDLDNNGDGVISTSEVPPGHALASEFKLVDVNHDGRITAAELANWH
ncbi:hypothetical protein [Pseudoxanthomonas dokdonensis]|uniref:EF-hand domain-containing protein n=1 Tax=Pseudoxanthomonas dokdonensis TaxID=344882 RepID=A0A0R0D0A7_9GAMM|nr:hypothetical protein [Pseudoxanthomonas dokdonensis]KRG71460.1 hypothetical protein ABB29_01380 [Pseudoxanthomonas dokdonensis]